MAQYVRQACNPTTGRAPEQTCQGIYAMLMARRMTYDETIDFRLGSLIRLHMRTPTSVSLSVGEGVSLH